MRISICPMYLTFSAILIAHSPANLSSTHNTETPNILKLPLKLRARMRREESRYTHSCLVTPFAPVCNSYFWHSLEMALLYNLSLAHNNFCKMVLEEMTYLSHAFGLILVVMVHAQLKRNRCERRGPISYYRPSKSLSARSSGTYSCGLECEGLCRVCFFSREWWDIHEVWSWLFENARHEVRLMVQTKGIRPAVPSVRTRNKIAELSESSTA